MNIKFITDLFKQKGVELTADEAFKIAQQDPAPTVDLSELKHNRQAIESFQSEFQSEFAKMKQSFQEQIQILQEENKNLLTALGEEKTQRENIANLQQKRAEDERKNQIKTIIEEATKDGRIPIENEILKNQYIAILETNLESGKAILEALPKPTIEVKPTANPIKPLANLTPMESYLSEIVVK